MDFNYTRFYTDAKPEAGNPKTGKDCMGPIAPSKRVSSQLAAVDANVKRSNLEYLI